MKEVIPLIYNTVENENKDWVPKAHYPSSASIKLSSGMLVGPDLLNQWLKWKGVRPSNPSKGAGLLKTRLGNGAHKELEKILQKSGIKIVSESSGKFNHPRLVNPISYRTDHLIDDEEGLGVLEVKSTMQQQMYAPWGIEKRGIWATHPDHVLQVICYLELVPGVRAGKFLYIDRGSGGMLEYNIHKTSDGGYCIDGMGRENHSPVPEVRWEGIIDRWVELEKSLKLIESPIPEYQAWINEKTGEVMDKKTIKGVEYKTNWRVLYNDYKDYIWKNPDNFKYSMNATFLANKNS